jgi:hypothetical protein
MRATIVPSDDVVIVDGRGLTIALDGYAQLDGLNAVQWNEVSGVIEFDNRGASEFKPNEKINSIAPYQDIIDAWQAAADAQDKRKMQATTYSNAPIMGEDIKDIIGR